jgi:hypothetical protein
MDRIGTSSAPEHQFLHGHESVMEAVRWAYDDPTSGMDSSHIIAIVYLRPTTGSRALNLCCYLLTQDVYYIYLLQPPSCWTWNTTA